MAGAPGQGRRRRRRLWRRDRGKYIRMWGEGRDRRDRRRAESGVRLVPAVELVLGGSKTLADITMSYNGLSRRRRQARPGYGNGDRPGQAPVRTRERAELPTTGSSCRPASTSCGTRCPRSTTPQAQGTMLHAWRAGPQTVACATSSRRCPTAAFTPCRSPSRRTAARPGPYERACQVAWYFKRAKPK